MDDVGEVNDENVGATDVDSRVGNFIQKKYDHVVCEWRCLKLFEINTCLYKLVAFIWFYN